jgi:hypothetical protein
MSSSRFAGLLPLLVFAHTVAFAARPQRCVTTDEAAAKLNKDICISAHIYEIDEVSDGTRFLDVCSPSTPDDQCRFTIVSLPQDHNTVGELSGYRDQDVQIRGSVQPMNGRVGVVLSHVRQFSGGQPRFRPNPLLAHGFNADQSRPPINDPNLRRQGGRRAFMNTRDQEPLPAK